MQKHPSLTALEKLMSSRLVILDGAMGTMLQRLNLDEHAFRGERFKDAKRDLKGNSEALIFSQPRALYDIHMQYCESGADIIETNTFNANSISQGEYLLQSHVREMNLEACRIARRAADDYTRATGRRIFVAGSIGPSNKTLSLSPEVGNPAFRAVDFDEVTEAYSAQAAALVESGADLLLVETVFDTLNLKACLYAIQNLQQTLGTKLALILSVTISDLSGRTLSGQTLEAFYVSIKHSDPLAIGMNCALGGAGMRPWIQEMARFLPTPIVCYPNAGLPNPLAPTGYDETPTSFAATLKQMAGDGLLNIVGGCCGTTPDHIRALVEAVKDCAPRAKLAVKETLQLSGLEPLNFASGEGRPFYLIGERTNVMGSPKFSAQIRQGNWPAALQVARQQAENGANLLDINFDEALLDGVGSMRQFLRLIASEPDIAARPLVIDSSDWRVLLEGMKNTQGRCLVNSLSLKDGEKTFLERASEVKKLGAAVIVMAFDENGQAADLSDKLRICQRAFQLLVDKAGFSPSDIVFDPNVLAIATGISEHNDYAKNFIESLIQIREACPGARTSGGISNLSFSFRGQNRVREAMHTVFLYHAIRAGLDMAIVNAGMIQIYENLDSRLRDLCEDVIFNRSSSAGEELVDFAKSLTSAADSSSASNGKSEAKTSWRQGTVNERIAHALVQGIEDHIEADALAAMKELGGSALRVIEEPLMDGMKIVGDLFGAGKMFLPQVVKSARVMKKAVAFLEPYMPANQLAESRRETLVLATVKGDVHDIGKNIVAVVLACNGYKVEDMGVMVPAEKILDKAKELNADFIGLSGLITPSLEEMAFVAERMEQRGLKTPLLIGGATTSQLHTAVRIAPKYSAATIHVQDASRVVGVLKRLKGEDRVSYVASLKKLQGDMRDGFARAQSEIEYLPLNEARQQAQAQLEATPWTPPTPSRTGVFDLRPDASEIAEIIDWSPFFWTWELRGKYPAILSHERYGAQATQLMHDARALLKQGFEDGWLERHVRLAILSAHSRDESVVVSYKDGEHEIPFMRRQMVTKSKAKGLGFLCLADWITPEKVAAVKDHLGAFIVTSGYRCMEKAKWFESRGDDYSSIMVKALGDRIAEALAEWAHLQFRKWMGSGEDLSLEDLLAEKYQGIRPAPGYAACPDHKLKEDIWKVLGGGGQGNARLSQTLSMEPAGTVAGFMFYHPQARYFQVESVAPDQLDTLARKRGLTVEELKRWIAFQV